MSCLWEGFLNFMLVILGVAAYIGLFAGAGYLIGRLFGRAHDDCGVFVAITLVVAVILGIGVIYGLGVCGII